jgi:hypothetical protein
MNYLFSSFPPLFWLILHLSDLDPKHWAKALTEEGKGPGRKGVYKSMGNSFQIWKKSDLVSISNILNLQKNGTKISQW